MPQIHLTLDLLPDTYAVALLPPDSRIPSWAEGGDLVSITRTSAEISIVCKDSAIPLGVQSQRGFRCLRVLGPLDFTLVGVLASLANPLARESISIFALSTYETDYLFIPGHNIEAALATLSASGHAIRRVGAA